MQPCQVIVWGTNSAHLLKCFLVVLDIYPTLIAFFVMLQWNDELKIIPEAVKITKQKIWSLVMIRVMIYNKWFVGNCNDNIFLPKNFLIVNRCN